MPKEDSLDPEFGDILRLKPYSQDDMSSLCVAVKDGRLEEVEKIIGEKPELLFHQDRELGMSPLQIAAENGHLDIVNTMLEHGAYIDEVSTNVYRTPLSFAAINGHTEVVKELLSTGASIEVEKQIVGPLHDAKNIEIADLLIKNGADVEYIPEEGNNRPLAHALSVGNKELVAFLLDKDADVNAINKNGVPTLIQAKEADNNFGTNFTKQILDSGRVDLNIEYEGIPLRNHFQNQQTETISRSMRSSLSESKTNHTRTYTSVNTDSKGHSR